MYRFILISCIALSPAAYADPASKRIEVYELSQTYVDVHDGDTLSEITAALLPHNPALRQQLMTDIMRMNSASFPESRADRMLAGQRLFLPNTMNRSDSAPDPKNIKVESYSWGNIKRPR